MARPKVHDAELADRLLEEAAVLVSREGPEGLGLRGLAQAAGTSTTAIYSLFGSKEGLLHSLYEKVFRSFGDSQLLQPSDDPEADLLLLGEGYRRWARQNPQLFPLMFDCSVQRTTTEADAIAAGTREPLLAAVGRAQASGVIDSSHDPELVALSLWGQVHGLVSLELGGLGLDPEAADTAYRACLAAVVRGWAPGRSQQGRR